jgi:hypothetical protein
MGIFQKRTMKGKHQIPSMIGCRQINNVLYVVDEHGIAVLN